MRFGTLCLAGMLLILAAGTAHAQTTEFTYQGKLTVSGADANGPYDMRFRLFDAETGGTEVSGIPWEVDNGQVTAGIFKVVIDFGQAFPLTQTRWLQIEVRPGDSTGAYTLLDPRQKVTAAPYAVTASLADTANTANDSAMVGGFPPEQLIKEGDLRLTDARQPLPDSPSYVQIGAPGTQSGSFDVNGNGKIGSSLTVFGNTFLNANLSVGGTITGTVSNATTASNALNLGGVAAGQYVVTTDPRMTDARNPLPGSTNYIRNTGVQQVSSSFNISGNGTAGGTLSGGIVNATNGYDIAGIRVLQAFNGAENVFAGIDAGPVNTGTNNSFFGHRAGILNTTGGGNSFTGNRAGASNTTGFNNAFFGYSAGSNNTTGTNNTFLGFIAGAGNTTGTGITLVGSNANVGSASLSFATAIGANAVVTASDRIQLGRATVDTVRIGRLDNGFSATHVCIADGVLSQCSSSRRYKEDIQPLAGGLNVVRLFRPVNFKWKDREERDIGMIAEEVAEIEPLLVTHNQNGEIEGVKYDVISVLLINAVKEQQAQIERQNREIDEQRHMIQSLKNLVCVGNPAAEICKEK